MDGDDKGAIGFENNGEAKKVALFEIKLSNSVALWSLIILSLQSLLYSILHCRCWLQWKYK